MTDVLVRGVNWGKWAGDAPAWLQAGEAPAHCLFDLRPTANDLSVYRVPEGSPPDRVAVALAGTKQRFDAAGFIAFDPAIVNDLGIVIDDTQAGKTPDPTVDEWHENLIQLSATAMARLATRLWELRDDPQVVLGQLLAPTVVKRLVEGVTKGELKLERMHADLRPEVEKKIAEGG